MSMTQPNPGAVAGPGKLTKRTDLPPKQGIKRLPNPAYGEQQQFMQQEAAAPMAKSPSGMPSVTPLGAPTQRPNEPVTAGVDAGAGPGREVLGLQTPIDTQLQDLSTLAKYMPLLAQYADSPQSSGTMKAFVNYLRSQSE